jgi:hypothetical protein
MKEHIEGARYREGWQEAIHHDHGHSVKVLTCCTAQKTGKAPLEEVKNILAPLVQLTSDP